MIYEAIAPTLWHPFSEATAFKRPPADGRDCRPIHRAAVASETLLSQDLKEEIWRSFQEATGTTNRINRPHERAIRLKNRYPFTRWRPLNSLFRTRQFKKNTSLQRMTKHMFLLKSWPGMRPPRKNPVRRVRKVPPKHEVFLDKVGSSEWEDEWGGVWGQELLESAETLDKTCADLPKKGPLRTLAATR